MNDKSSVTKRAVLFILLFAIFFGLSFFFDHSTSSKRTSYQICAKFEQDTMTVEGSMSVDYYNDSQSELKEVKFHLYPNAYKEGQPSPITSTQLSQAFPNGISYGGIEISNVKADGKSAQYSGSEGQIMTVCATVNPFERIKIDMDFLLTIPNARHRLGYYDGSINLGNWFPIVCVYENGEWDEHTYYPIGDPFYSNVADFEVEFTFLEGYEFASTGESELKSGQTTVKVRANNVRDFAICLTKNREYSRICNGVTVKYFGKENETKFLDTAAAALETFSSLFGDYPYQSLSVVKTPFTSGGMEYPGIVYVCDELNEAMTHEVIIHEIAHQWWYAAVGNNQVTEAWMDEGLTEYSTTLFYEYNSVFGISKSQRIADAMTAYMLYSEDNLGKSEGDSAMNKNLTEFTDHFNYSYLTYLKGELMFDTLLNVIGKENFLKGLRTYYKKYKFKNAKTDDMIGCFERASKKELKGFFDSWILGKVKMY